MTSSVIESLTSLSPAELREVMGRATYLLNPTGSDAPRTAMPAIDGDQELVWTEVREAVRLSGGDDLPPLPVYLARARRGDAGLSRRATAAAMRSVRSDFRAAGRAEQIKVVRLLLGLAATELSDRGLPVRPRTLFTLLAAPASLLDRHFPGYGPAGLLPMLVKRVRVK